MLETDVAQGIARADLACPWITITITGGFAIAITSGFAIAITSGFAIAITSGFAIAIALRARLTRRLRRGGACRVSRAFTSEPSLGAIASVATELGIEFASAKAHP